jgi:MoaA/NifB/PqqE/SkfB family radical SAM enzyme
MTIDQTQRHCSQAQAAVNVVAYIDTNNSCNLRCQTCVRGLQGMQNSGRRMPIDKFSLIVDKLYREGYTQIGLYNWTEPFLTPDLQEYVKIVKSYKMYCQITSNFSLREIPHLEAVLQSGLDYLSISVSGFDQDVYEVNHAGGNVAYVKDNLRRAATIKKNDDINILLALRFLKFNYNHCQETKLDAFAQELGVKFEIVEGRGNPLEQMPILTAERLEDQLRSYKSERPFEEAGKVCPLIFGAGTAIDSGGTAHLCCCYPDHPAVAIGSYVDLPQEEILLRRYFHPICAVCTFPRRDATLADKQVLIEAMQHRLGSVVPPAR